MSEAELRRQATAAGVFLDISPRSDGHADLVRPWVAQYWDEPEAEQLLVWLDQWQEPDEPRERHEVALHCGVCNRPSADVVRFSDGLAITPHCNWCAVERNGAQTEAVMLPIVRPLLDPPAGFELVRRSWCPRCDRIGGDPLGWWHNFGGMKGYLRRPRCAVFPTAPELEIAPGCKEKEGYIPRGQCDDGEWWDWEWRRCGARRLYRWGLRRVRKLGNRRPIPVRSRFVREGRLHGPPEPFLGPGW